MMLKVLLLMCLLSSLLASPADDFVQSVDSAVNDFEAAAEQLKEEIQKRDAEARALVDKAEAKAEEARKEAEKKHKTEAEERKAKSHYNRMKAKADSAKQTLKKRQKSIENYQKELDDLKSQQKQTQDKMTEKRNNVKNIDDLKELLEANSALAKHLLIRTSETVDVKSASLIISLKDSIAKKLPQLEVEVELDKKQYTVTQDSFNSKDMNSNISKLRSSINEAAHKDALSNFYSN